MRWIKTALNFVGGSLPAQIGIALFAIGLVIWAIASQIDDVADDARTGGRAEVRAEVAEEGLANVEAANQAAAAVSRDPAVRDAACLRHSRTPENC